MNIENTAIDNLVVIDGEKYATINQTPGITYYKEEVVKQGSIEYRVWSPFKSKLAAAFKKGLDPSILTNVKNILYLGASTGTTVSHLSDILDKGVIYAVEIGPRVMMEFVNRVVKYRKNVVPLFFDARLPESYVDIVDPPVDMVYCDVAQPDQTKILLDNADLYLKNKGLAMIAIKARSIDAVAPVKEIYHREIKYIESRGYEVREVIDLEPFEKEHALAVIIKP